MVVATGQLVGRLVVLPADMSEGSLFIFAPVRMRCNHCRGSLAAAMLGAPTQLTKTNRAELAKGSLENPCAAKAKC